MKFDGREDQMEILREIAENVLDPVFLVDRMKNVWYYNRAFEVAIGVRMSAKRFRDQPCCQLLGLEICDGACVMAAAVSTGKNARLAEIKGRTAGGEERNFNINAVPVFNSSGVAFGAIIFLRDMTAETTIHDKYKRLVARNSAVSLSGQLAEGALADVIQLLAFLQKSGQLTLSSRGEQGEIHFVAGKMVSICLGTVQNEKALGRMVRWHEGGFAFNPQVVSEAGESLIGSSDFLLMNAIREEDEVRARAAELPGLESTPRASTPPAAGVDELGHRILALAAESRTVREMLDILSEPDARIYLALLSLKDAGLLVW